MRLGRPEGSSKLERLNPNSNELTSGEWAVSPFGGLSSHTLLCFLRSLLDDFLINMLPKFVVILAGFVLGVNCQTPPISSIPPCVLDCTIVAAAQNNCGLEVRKIIL